jgi:ribosomal protein S18 acetylase RimI-like enzyme
VELRIREVHAKDKDIIEAIIKKNENFTEEEKCCAVELLDIYLKDTVRGEYLFICAADEADKPLGYACYGRAPFTDSTYDVYWIAVEPLWQGMKVGKKIMNHLENILEREKAKMIIAETSSQPKYDKARLFYERLGFIESARIKDFYRSGDDKIIYVKKCSG